jgi:hypothetical protein
VELCSGGAHTLRSFILERREFQKVTLSNLFYLSLEVGREKVNMSAGFSGKTHI